MGADLALPERSRAGALLPQLSDKGLRYRLRDETRHAHARLDTGMGALDMARPEDLERFLQVQFAALSCLEPAMAWVRDLSAPPSQLPLLRRDLVALGAVPPMHLTVGRLQAHPLGMIYVVAGAHLGGRVLERRWRVSQNRKVRRAGAFLTSRALADYWRQFLAHLSHEQLCETERRDVIDGALKAFGVFQLAVDTIMPTRA